MTSLKNIDLHDGIIKSIFISFENKSAEIYVGYYPESDSSERKDDKIKIEDLRYVALIADIDKLSFMGGHGGNINEWSDINLDEARIDLCGGYLNISRSNSKKKK